MVAAANGNGGFVEETPYRWSRRWCQEPPVGTEEVLLGGGLVEVHVGQGDLAAGWYLAHSRASDSRGAHGINSLSMSSYWQRAEEIEWEGFYRAVEGRALREVFVDALPLLPAASPDERPLVAIDLGCGDGKEALELLTLGWTVLATDRAPEGIGRLLESVPPAARERLTTRVASFTDVDFQDAELVYAGLSLPFCKPADFEQVWRKIVTGVRPGGFFVGHLFGPHDTWAGTPDMTFHSRMEVEELLSGFEIVSLREQDEDGPAVGGPKHWHVFHVIARRRAGTH
jgi:SAM-dependent methyltransferase